ncbi:GGDEF domain-containing protein [Crassaminicella profunda]|uniref:GGDEF domain-containing protein n=1 Tax=Crassaminicella profunda TaxID=1286698 RepID=UPI001CA6C041|nr:GGDEF domain-containing protein [Crassaminicella profunda]QZY55825.1 GGDEF domain-containing protein [Crassaminicella profunda]
MNEENNFNFSMFINENTWNRKILNYFWLALILSFLGSFTNYLFCHDQNLHYIKYDLILPTTILLVLMLTTEIIYYFSTKFRDITIIVITSLFVSVLVSIHEDVQALQTAYILPILISIGYFELKKTIFSFILNLSSFFIIYANHPFIFENTFLGQLIAMVLVLFIGFLISIEIMCREKKMLHHIHKAMKSKEDLLIKNIVMEQNSKIDPLTGLYNHRSFHEYLDILIEQAKQDNVSIHLAILDIDNFKQVNDTFGHGVGDLVLKRISSTIKNNISFNDFPSRYGGEEFAVIFTDITLAEAHKNIDHIRILIEDTFHEELKGRPVTVSIGLQEYKKEMDKKSLFESADALLYLAKKMGKNKTITQKN